SEELRQDKPRISKHEGGLVSKQSVKNRDVIKSHCGATAFRELALLGVFCGVTGVTALMPAASAGAGIVRGQQGQGGGGVMLSKQATAKEVGCQFIPGPNHTKTRR